MRDQVSCYGLELSDVREAFVNGDVLCAIIHRFRPDLIEYPLPSEENVDPLHTAAFRNQIAFDLLHEEYGLTHVGILFNICFKYKDNDDKQHAYNAHDMLSFLGDERMGLGYHLLVGLSQLRSLSLTNLWDF